MSSIRAHSFSDNFRSQRFKCNYFSVFLNWVNPSSYLGASAERQIVAFS